MTLIITRLDHLYSKRLAAGAGFDLCGIAPCRHLAENEALFRAWLARGRQSSLGYLERNVDKRFDARRLVEGARTAVVCAVSYKNRVGEGYPPGHRTKVASYACAADYHATLRTMLGGMLDALRAAHPGLGGRAFVDTAPLAEKQLAVEAGLGWIGRQSLLVTPQYGSYVVLGELILTEETDRYDAPFEGSRCGTCRSCIDNCPTGAVAPDRTIDTGRCISCRTIEREQPGQTDLHGWIFGCDACQSLCPWNRRAPQHRNAAFDAVFDPLAMDAATFETPHPKSRRNAEPAPRSGTKKRVPEIRNPLCGLFHGAGGSLSAALRKTRQAALFLLRPAGYLVSSANAAFALSTAGPAVTFRKASMACGFISLAL